MYENENQNNTKDISQKTKQSILKKLQENVSNLDKLEQIEIFRIIQKYENKLTENKNGIFINLSCLCDTCIDEISKFVSYSLDNKKRLNKIELMSQNIFKNSILNKQYNEYNTSINLKSPKNKKDDPPNKDVMSDKKHMFMNKTVVSNESNNNLEESKYDSDIDNEDIMENISELDDLEETKTYEMSTLIQTVREDVSNHSTIEQLKQENVSKKNKWTGKRGRLYKKCRELNKCYQINSIMSYNTYNNDVSEIIINDDGDDDMCLPTNELTEDKI